MVRPSRRRRPQLEEALGALRWGVNYLLRCHPHPGVLYAQVGDFVVDHASWGPPAAKRPASGSRPVFNLTLGQPATDVAAEVTAALAVASMVFGEVESSSGEAEFPSGEAEFSSSLLAAAISVYNMATVNPGPANANNPKRSQYVYPQCAWPEEGGECFYWTFASTVDLGCNGMSN